MGFPRQELWNGLPFPKKKNTHTNQPTEGILLYMPFCPFDKHRFYLVLLGGLSGQMTSGRLTDR